MNDYLFLGICSVVAIACFYVIIAPFFARKPAALFVSEGDDMSEALSVESIYLAVNELEMDFLMKKITKEDFLQLKEHYQMMAADLLNKREPVRKSEEEIKTGAAVMDREILAELTKIRSRKGR